MGVRWEWRELKLLPAPASLCRRVFFGHWSWLCTHSDHRYQVSTPLTRGRTEHTRIQLLYFPNAQLVYSMRPPKLPLGLRAPS